MPTARATRGVGSGQDGKALLKSEVGGAAKSSARLNRVSVTHRRRECFRTLRLWRMEQEAAAAPYL